MATTLGAAPSKCHFVGELKLTAQLYAAPDGSFAVARARTDDGQTHVLVGAIAHLDRDTRVAVRARFEHHPRYGERLRVLEAKPLDPAGAEGMRRYLCTLPHIGPARAGELIARHGLGLFEALDGDPYPALLALPGMSPQRALAASLAWGERRAGRELYALLAPHGLARFVAPLIAEHGPDALATVRANPYTLTRLRGVGFPSADRLARALGVKSSDPRRARAAVYHLLTEAETAGHSHLPLAELRRRGAALLGAKPDLAVIEAAPGVTLDAERAYRSPTHRAERAVARALRVLAESPAHLPPFREPSASDLSAEQRAAVRHAFGARLSVVTGGPGTGKSYLTDALCRAASTASLRVLLCAPTGRAARRLTQATGGLPAHTLHRLLDWRPGEQPVHGPTKPLPCDLLICDEASMLSLELAHRLLAAIAPRTHLVLIGDVDQLAPVGPGTPFAELIAAGISPVSRLTHVFRQAQRSLIVRAAHAVNSGAPPPEPSPPATGADFFVVRRSDPERAAEAVVELVARRIPTTFSFDPIRDVQVLSPEYRGPLGVDALNDRLREALNPHGEPCFQGRFRVGDKLLCTQNAYELGLRNGMLLTVTGRRPAQAKLLLETEFGGSLELPYQYAGLLRPGFAVSVHKAQGFELPAVVCVCHSCHAAPLLRRNLLYTAITRARSLCVLVADTPGLARALRQGGADERHSFLRQRLRSPLP